MSRENEKNLWEKSSYCVLRNWNSKQWFIWVIQPLNCRALQWVYSNGDAWHWHLISMLELASQTHTHTFLSPVHQMLWLFFAHSLSYQTSFSGACFFPQSILFILQWALEKCNIVSHGTVCTLLQTTETILINSRTFTSNNNGPLCVSVVYLL